LKNPFKLLRDLQPKPQLIPTHELKHLTDEDRRLLTQIGITASQLFKSMQAETTVNYDRARFYNEITKACITGDTKVWLLNGTTPTIKEMAENSDEFIGKYTFSINPNTLCLEPDKILFIKKTHELANLIRVHLDNDQSVDCTPDHHIMLRDGSYKEAKDLEPNDSLMPLYIKFYKRGLSEYPLAYNPGTTRYRYVHQLVAKSLYGYKSNHGLVIHHKNFNVMDNDPSNLEMMESNKHKELHGKYAHRKHDVNSCKCFVCKAIRGETKGKNSPGFGKEPWNKGETKDTNQTVAKYADGLRKVKVFITSTCNCGCGEQFRNNIPISDYKFPRNKRHKYLPHHGLRGRTPSQKCHEMALVSNTGRIPWDKGLTKSTSEIVRKIAEKNSCGNHKVVKVEWLVEKQDVYDLGVENNHNFPLACGIFVHNCEHWMVGPALELYADYVSNYNHLHGASVWITAESPTYQKELTKLLDRIGIEEKIFDWAWTVGGFGDLFVKIHGIPNDGVISIDDDEHPLNTSRVDYEGTLIGFYKTPQGQTTGTGKQELIAPWEYIHMRLLGAKRKRPQFSDPMYAEFRTMHLMSGTDTKQVSSRYGTSILLNSLPTYKRLRLAEDSLLMARLTRGIIRYIWKLKVDSCLSPDTHIELMDGTNPTIKEMAENKDKYIGKGILTIDEKDNGLSFGYIGDVKKTRLNAQLVRVWLDNSEYVDCTPDHKFMLRDGSYKEAQDLQSMDSLMPYYDGLSRNGIHGYKMIYDPKINRKKMVHRLPFGRMKRGLVIHHKDFNKLNNDPSNLQIMSTNEHVEFHHKVSTNYGWPYSVASKPRTKDHVNKILDSKRKNGTINLSEETKRKISEGLKKFNKEHDVVRKIQSEYSRLKNKLSHLGIGHPHSEQTKNKLRSIAKRVTKAFITKTCACGCGEQFRFVISPNWIHKQRFVGRHNTKGNSNPSHKKYLEKRAILNHKVVKVEWLKERQDTYDITINSSSPNFPLSVGVFVHNSNAEATNALLTMLVGMLKKARALDTSSGSPNFDSKFGPLSSVEDLLIPVWGDVDDLTYDKIGEDADIRWIVDIKELRNQLACALRTPLSVLGGYVEEATGPLGAQSIEKLSVEFAHTARRLQRALKVGIKRMCQIHLAYMNMDPDPRLFEVEMSETSTAEEEAIRDSLDKGVDTIQKIIQLMEDVDPEGIDKKKVVDYLNQKILKLEDFDLDDFKKVMTTGFKESKESKNKPEIYIPVVNSDLMSYLPLNELTINESKVSIGSALNLRWQNDWKQLYEGKIVIERELEKAPN